MQGQYAEPANNTPVNTTSLLNGKIVAAKKEGDKHPDIPVGYKKFHIRIINNAINITTEKWNSQKIYFPRFTVKNGRSG